MPLEIKMSIPLDPDYATRLGAAIYAFAYYEWIIIYIIEYLDPGFVNEYSRDKSLTSGKVAERLRKVVDAENTDFKSSTKDELTVVREQFEPLIERRNALIHGHPITDTDGDSVLAYQGKITKAISDMKWPNSEIMSFIADVDTVVIFASNVQSRLR